jgi:polysaccharide biosynthesis/export protein
MKNSSAHGFFLILAGLLLTAQIARAQDLYASDSSSKPAHAKCLMPVTITGAVRAPGRIELRRRLRLRELLAVVGGLTERAGKEVEITRAALDSDCRRPSPDNRRQQPGRIEVYALAEVVGGSEKANPYLEAGDYISVPEVNIAYVTGHVARPQQIFLKEPTTLTQAIASAGDMLPQSAAPRVSIIRGCGSVMKEITVDVQAIRKGRAEDILLQPYDLVIVPPRRGHGSVYSFCPEKLQLSTELPLRIVY